MLETKPCECESRSEADKAQRLREFLARLRGVPGALTPALHAAQDIFGALTQPVQQLVADELGLSLAEVYEVATFYSFFTLKPKGRHVVRVCFGTACYVRGAAKVLHRLQAELRIKVGDTTEDGEFSLELCRCLGACGLAPVITVDGHIEPEVSPTGIPYILAKHREAALRVPLRITHHASRTTWWRRPPSVSHVHRILLCGGTGCKSAGCDAVREAIERELSAARLGSQVKLSVTGCFGSCALGPVMLTQPDGTFYQRVKPEDAAAIVRRHLFGGKPVSRLLHSPDQARMSDIPFFSRQQRLVRVNTGALDAESLDDYLAVGGFQALKKALAMKPAEVVEVVKQSGLRGRGGAGFPTGLKWEAAMKADSPEKFVVCNCDEGDPGAFMDRSILEGDPFCIVEAMAIAGHAMGARKGFVHVRAEYPLAFSRLAKAIEKARSAGHLGERFDVELRAGAGAFVCGEETALLRSLEGHRPHPRPRPPYPAHEGLWGKPTLVNNVETLANIPPIIRHGADWFRSFGAPSSPGTKVFALAGDVLHTGLVEVPMGTPLRAVVHDIGGGIRDGKALKAVQIGGPSGGCVPTSLLDTPLDYESLAKLDTIMGSGGLIVLSETTCMVNLAKFFMEFVQAESCGRCVPCRLGTKRMLDIVTGICEGRGAPGDLAELEDLGRKIKLTALCGLGRTAPNPVLSTLRHFRDEYEFHIKEKRCPVKVCRPAFRYRIDPARCNGCSNCLPACEDRAIFPQPASPYVLGPYVIRQDRCDACGDCVEKCPFDAIVREGSHQ